MVVLWWFGVVGIGGCGADLLSGCSWVADLLSGACRLGVCVGFVVV
jgi:hypothetical protein